jgi:hypothetical protein
MKRVLVPIIAVACCVGAPAAEASQRAIVPPTKVCKRLGPATTSVKGKIRGKTSCAEAREVVAQWFDSNDGGRPDPRTTVAPSLGPWYCVANYRRAGLAKVSCRVPKSADDYRYARIYFTVVAE